jgi:hypothetical protein
LTTSGQNCLKSAPGGGLIEGEQGLAVLDVVPQGHQLRLHLLHKFLIIFFN